MADPTTTITPADIAPIAVTEATAENVEPPIEGEEALGDPGKRALDAMKAENRQLKADLRAKTKEAEDAAATTEVERARLEGQRDTLAKIQKQMVEAKILAEATGKLVKPANALAFLKPTDFEVSEDGSVDSEAISDAITKLLADEPHLAAQGGAVTQIKPDGSQGASVASTALTGNNLEQSLREKLGIA